ncbi:hypothetical protein CK203_047945 [Vitis vinifera]|uniref:Uncharacterized protein n=1 Tax=Vitis vinifera TaxID=29760 RepID=A0A438GH56_VITVI|nr:hypothetical protein CK203_047945 [Vitis vinifera]
MLLQEAHFGGLQRMHTNSRAFGVVPPPLNYLLVTTTMLGGASAAGAYAVGSSKSKRDGEGLWEVPDSKTFDLSIKVVRGKLKGLIVERGKGLSAWIRFGEVSLGRLPRKGGSLLQRVARRVEACCREEGALRWNTVWEEISFGAVCEWSEEMYFFVQW